MKILSALVIKNSGGDKVCLRTSFPSPCPKVDSSQLTVDFSAEYDKGVEYVLTHFPGVPIEIVERPQHDYRFSK